MSVRSSTNSPSSPTTLVQSFYSTSSVEKQNHETSQLSPNESFADSTYLRIDEQAADQLEQLIKKIQVSTIRSWIGHDPVYLYGRSSKISVKDARLINQNSETTIFEIDEKNLIEFKIIDAARKKLKLLYKTKKLDKELGLDSRYIYRITANKTAQISKENAEKIDTFYKTDVFCIHQIFERACTEKINEVVNEQSLNNSDQLTYIEFDENSQTKVKKLNPSTRGEISKIIGNSIYGYYKNITIRDAFTINKFAKLEIFKFSIEKLTTLPFTSKEAHLLKELISEKTKDCLPNSIAVASKVPLATALNRLKEGQKTIPVDIAKKIDKYFKTKMFDFEEILSKAQADALHFYEASIKSLNTTPQEKKKISQTPAKQRRPRDPAAEKEVPAAKKRKISSVKASPAIGNADASQSPQTRSSLQIAPEQLSSFFWNDDAWMVPSLDPNQATYENFSSFDPFSPNFDSSTNSALNPPRRP